MLVFAKCKVNKVRNGWKKGSRMKPEKMMEDRKDGRKEGRKERTNDRTTEEQYSYICGSKEENICKD